jgi:hypothetical protein
VSLGTGRLTALSEMGRAPILGNPFWRLAQRLKWGTRLIMARKKLRSITVDGRAYLWRFQPGYEKTADAGYRCRDVFVAYSKSATACPLRILFDPRYCPLTGGPLWCGAKINLEDAGSPAVNLNMPNMAAVLIRACLKRGWQPEQQRVPHVVIDGVKLLYDLKARGEMPEQPSPCIVRWW